MKSLKKNILPFIIYIGFFVGIVLVWRWVNHSPKEADTYAPLRRMLVLNEKFNHWVFGSATAPEYDKSKAVKKVRVNGDVGMDGKMDSTWRLHVTMPGTHVVKVITIDSIKALPKIDVIFDFKCIEGWSQITWWSGVKFSDFCAHYHINTDSPYAGLMTPDSSYYVGIDMRSMLNRQTILCYELNGKTLPQNQGYPLRLIIPNKYGVKHIKRIGSIYFSNKKPKDYWYERGYDFDASL